MGVWDQIRCEMPRPEAGPAEGAVFMTRDTPAQFFEDYTITAEGRLIHDGGEEVPFNGDLTFTDLSSVFGPNLCGELH
jgi:hypothetical protein